jgi:hypothetical protein
VAAFSGGGSVHCPGGALMDMVDQGFVHLKHDPSSEAHLVRVGHPQLLEGVLRHGASRLSLLELFALKCPTGPYAVVAEVTALRLLAPHLGALLGDGAVAGAVFAGELELPDCKRVPSSAGGAGAGSVGGDGAASGARVPDEVQSLHRVRLDTLDVPPPSLWKTVLGSGGHDTLGCDACVFSRVEGGEHVVHRIQLKLGQGKLDHEGVIQRFRCMESTAHAAFSKAASGWGASFAVAWQKLWLVTTREVRPEQRKSLVEADVQVVDGGLLRSWSVWPEDVRRLGEPF